MNWDTVQRIHDYLDRQVDRRQSNKVLHGHPSPMFWLERQVSVPKILVERERTYRALSKRLNVYVGTPYCLPTEPDRCGFCLFPSEVYQGRHQLVTYLEYLRREADLYRRWVGADDIGNVYFGGGTSNLYRAEQYFELMGVVRGLFPSLSPDAEITLEGIPQLFTRDKLAAMKAAGINRVSMGVQQLDDEMIKMSGRKQTAAHVFHVIEWCQELRLPLSVDLIFGWPRQTTELMLKDLDAIVRAGVSHITHYELNVAGRTDFARNRRAQLPSSRQNLELYQVSKQFLQSRGYRQVTAYDWEKADSALTSSYLYEETWHRPLRAEPDRPPTGVDLWGLGFAGISFFLGTPETPGWTYMNQTRVNDYFRLLDEGRFPVERGFHYAPKDLRLTVLFQMLQAMTVSLTEYAALFGVDLMEEYADIWAALKTRGWVSITADRLTLVNDGVFYTPLIQGLLSRGRMEELRKPGDGGFAQEALA